MYEALVTAERSGGVTRAAEPGTTTDSGQIDAFGANFVWLYCLPRITNGFIRGHSGNVDGGVALAIVNGKNGSSANRAGKAHSFDCSSSSRLFNDRAWP